MLQRVASVPREEPCCQPAQDARPGDSCQPGGAVMSGRDTVSPAPVASLLWQAMNTQSVPTAHMSSASACGRSQFTETTWDSPLVDLQGHAGVGQLGAGHQ